MRAAARDQQSLRVLALHSQTFHPLLHVNRLSLLRAGFIRLFPAGWAADSPASFTTLRADGGFLVSAKTQGGGVPMDVEVQSLAGRRCSVLLPRGWASVVVHKLPSADGSGGSDRGPAVAVTLERRGYGVRKASKLFGFATEAGQRYSLTDGAALPEGEAPPPQLLQSFGL